MRLNSISGIGTITFSYDESNYLTGLISCGEGYNNISFASEASSYNNETFNCLTVAKSAEDIVKYYTQKITQIYGYSSEEITRSYSVEVYLLRYVFLTGRSDEKIEYNYSSRQYDYINISYCQYSSILNMISNRKTVLENGAKVQDSYDYSYNIYRCFCNGSECNLDDPNDMDMHYETTVSKSQTNYRIEYYYHNSDLSVKKIINGNDCEQEEYEYTEFPGSKSTKISLINKNWYHIDGTGSGSGYDQAFTYNEKEQMLTSTISISVGVQNRTIMEYDSTYAIPTKKTVWYAKNFGLDGSHNIITTYTLSADKKSILTEQTEDRATDYEYDSNGNMIKIVRHNILDDEITRIVYDNNTPSDITDFRATMYFLRNEISYTYSLPHNTQDNWPAYPAHTVIDEKAYDSFGNLIRQKDGNGNVTLFSYDALYRPLCITNPDGTYQTISYEHNGTMVTVTDENSNSTRYHYNICSNETKVEKIPQNSSAITVSSSVYDNYSRLIRKTLYSDENLTEFGQILYAYYDNNKIASEIIKKGNTVYSEKIFSYNLNMNSQVRVRQSVEKETIFTKYFDEFGNCYEETAVGDGTTLIQSYEYDNMGNITKTIPYSSSSVSHGTEIYEYNSFGELIKTTNQLGVATEITYDKLGRKTSLSKDGLETNISYSELGQFVETTTATAGMLPNTNRKFYDKNGNLIKEQQNNNDWNAETLHFKTVDYTYDNRNRLIAAKCNDGTDGSVTQYNYDPVGNLIYTWSGLEEEGSPSELIAEDYPVLSYTYNHLNQLITQTDRAGNSVHFSYDLLGNLISQTDRNGITTSFSYDPQAKLTAKTASKDNSSDTVTYEYDKMGNLTKMIDSAGQTNYTYNGLGQLTNESRGNYVNQYTYDAYGNRETYKMYYNNTLKIDTSYSYDVLNRMSQVIGNNQTVSYEYNNSDQLIKTTTTDTQTNITSEVVNTYLFNDKISQTETINGQTVLTYSMYYLTDGTLEQVDTQSNISGIPSTAVSYEYDDMGRLTKEIQQSSGKNLTTDYTYDRNQNRTGKTDTLWNNGATSVTQTSYTYDINNRMLTESIASDTTMDVNQYTYDSNGNLTQMKQNNSVWRTIQYDLFNRPSRFVEQEIDYFYDGNGKRLKKRVLFCEDEDFVYDGENMVMSTRPYDEQIMFRGLFLIARKNTFDWGQGMDADYLEYYHLNPHGDVQFTSNTDGTIANTYTYDAFGNQLSTTNSHLPYNMDTNAFRYCGEYWNEDTGYIYLRARDYDPATGRFISEDSPYYMRQEQPLSLNLFTYCWNNPIAYIDPSGHDIYYYVTSEFYGEAVNDQVQLEKQYGEPVHIIVTDSAEEFEKQWNAMGNWNGQDVTVSLTVINMHGNADKLTVTSGGNAVDLNNLIRKNIGNIVLLVCNAGHYDHRISGLANQFLERNNVNSVIAADGAVQGSKDASYKITNDEFYDQLWKDPSGQYSREPFGFMKYVKAGRETIPYGLGTSFTNIISLLRAANII